MAQRLFLDWNQPCLEAAAAWLIDHAPTDPALEVIDLQRHVLVTPGRRAARMLTSLLVEAAESRGASLIPPRIITPGVLAEVMFSETPVTGESHCRATPNEVLLAWSRALRDERETVHEALAPDPPEEDDIAGWHDLARLCADAHETLAGEGRTLLDAAEAAARLDRPREVERWHALHHVAETYRRILYERGLTDPHEDVHESIKRSDVIAPAVERLVMIGVVDLNAVQRAMIDRLDDRVLIMIHADESLADAFDEHGCVITGHWMDRSIDIRDEQLIIADRPADQAQRALRALASIDPPCAPQDVTIGIPDETLAGPIERAAAWAGIHAHNPTGAMLRQTGPGLLLSGIAAWLSEPRFAHFTALLRHPDLEHYLAESRRHGTRGVQHWLGLLDRYFEQHLQEHIDGAWLGTADEQQQLRAIHREIQHLLAPFDAPPQPLRDWCAPVLQVLNEVYGHEGAAPASIEAAHRMTDLLDDIAHSDASLQPHVDAASALSLFMALMGDDTIAPPVRAEQIEMLGWLELHLDPAPHLVLTGANDGALPQSVHGDALLPDSLRRALGLMHNDCRLARDVYLMQAILHSRQNVTIIAGRRGRDDDPLVPSRLLLACDDETLLLRVRRLCADIPEDEPPLPIGLAPPAQQSRFVIPELPALFPPELMSVTDFRIYLNCPYRYALARLLKLKAIGERTDAELDGAGFGALAHDVFRAFGRHDDARHATDADVILDFLLAELHRQASRLFGTRPAPAVLVQLARLEQRLRGFARLQAMMRNDGWHIEQCELDIKGQVALEIPGDAPMPLHGVIDRIDRHEQSGAWRIVDYKTGESGLSPHKSHHGIENISRARILEWIDLQLPLYHYLFTRSSKIDDAAIELGYIVLPKQADHAGLALADWREDHLHEAIACAQDVVRSIRAGRFEPNREMNEPWDEFARILQVNAMTRDDERGASAEPEA